MAKVKVFIDSDVIISSNIKDYKLVKIADELGIRILLPGELLEYLRNLD